jgi:hypothetical protein
MRSRFEPAARRRQVMPCHDPHRPHRSGTGPGPPSPSPRPRCLLALQLAPLRRARAEDRLDFKFMYYQEDDGRIQVTSPAALLEKEFAPALHQDRGHLQRHLRRLAHRRALVTTPGWSPPAASEPYSVYVQESEDNERSGRAEERDDDDDDEREDRGEEEREDEEEGGLLRLNAARPARSPGLPAACAACMRCPAPRRQRTGLRPHRRAGPRALPLRLQLQSRPSDRSSSSGNGSTAAPAPAPAPTQTRLPRAEIEDERVAANVELIKRLGSHTVSALFSFSTETDYESIGLAVRDAIDFNKKNTTLNLGAAFTHDTVEAYVRGTSEDKDTVEGMVGLTQVLSPKTLLTLNLTLGRVEGYLDDQYKVVWLNGALAPEHRPDQKDKHIAYVALLRYIETLRGSAELGYRFYDDTFGIQAHTFTLAWHQKLGPALVLSPMVRWYEQSEADFYGTEFAGTPTYYSSDYRVSALQAMGYGLKLVWRPTPAWSLDLAAERYEQEGTDGLTPDETYPAANLVTGGIRLWF